MQKNYFSKLILFLVISMFFATNSSADEPSDSTVFNAKSGKSNSLTAQFDSLFVNYLIKENPGFSGSNLIALQTSLIFDYYKKQNEETSFVRLTTQAPYMPIGYNNTVSHDVNQMDSLLNEWYALFDTIYQNSYDGNFVSLDEDSLGEPLNLFPDSVYIERIKNIPAVVELSFTEESKKWIERYTRPRSKNFVQHMIGLAEYYGPIVEEILDQYNIPLEMKYLPIIESGYVANAVSPVGATGYWQFMPGTGKVMGLEANGLVDERSDPIRSTHAAAQYLKLLYDYYHDWTLALAAYNCGPGNVNRAIKRSNKTTYWEIMSSLPRETQKYVPRFIAAAYLMNYYKDYGLVAEKLDLPTVTDTVNFYKNVSLAQISSVAGIPLTTLEQLNPHFKRDIIPGNFGKYTLRVPMKNATQVINLRDSIMAYKGNQIPNLDDNSLKIAMNSKSKRSKTKAKISNQDGYMCYTIQSGDNFWNIAKKFQGITYSDIIEANGMTANSKLVPGNLLKIKKL